MSFVVSLMKIPRSGHFPCGAGFGFRLSCGAVGDDCGEQAPPSARRPGKLENAAVTGASQVGICAARA
jgi:hypothetical protein